MDKVLTLDAIQKDVQAKVFVQDYSPKTKIDGVKVTPLKNIVGEDGDICEIVRIDANGELESLPGYKLAQVNRTKILPDAVKAWHLHYNQDDIWHVTPRSHLFVGLWDVREDSPTKGVTMRLSPAGGNAYLIYIPRGVAHGVANFSGEPGEILYLVNQHFSLENPDENRLPWDAAGAEFWQAVRE